MSSPFDALIATADNLCLKTFSLAVQFYPQAGGGPITITGITRNPAMEEDYTPGSLSGVTSIRLFVRLLNPDGSNAITPLPYRGDVFHINAVVYDLFEVLADREGGAVLDLRRNT